MSRDMQRPRSRRDRHTAENRPTSEAPRTSRKRKGPRTEVVTVTRGRRVEFKCEVCGNTSGAANYCYRTDAYGQARAFVECYSCEAEGIPRNEWPALVAEAVGAPGGHAIIAHPERWLTPLTGEQRRRAGAESGRLPSVGAIEGCASVLFTDEGRRALRWLTRTRGLTLEVIKAERIGFDRARRVLVFPMFRRGELVAAKQRAAAGNMRWYAGCRKNSWPLYPEPEPGAWTLLTEGELDALRARSAGLPATSITGGVSTWKDEWPDDLAGLRVVVCFDVGAEEHAKAVVRKLQESGIRARRLDLRRLGLRKRGADLSDYLNGGGSAAAIRKAAR